MLLAVLVLGCGPSEEPPPASSADTAECAGAGAITWEGFAHSFYTTYCIACHSSDNVDSRYDAPLGVDFDSEAGAAAYAARVRARVIDDESMPLGGGVYPEDLALLDIYLRCQLGQ